MDRFAYCFPTSEIEITNTEICSCGKFKRLPKRGEQLQVDVVEYARHLDPPELLH